MLQAKAYASFSATGPMQPHTLERRAPKPNDVVIAIDYCGICHSDIHNARGEWGETHYPCVPGHEIIGRVIQLGKRVKKFKVGETVGVGCFVDSCGTCSSCKNNEEQFCLKHCAHTYGSVEMDGKTPTYGGYSSHIVVRDKFVLKIKKDLPLPRVAPLLCAGITTYSPLKRHGVKKGSKVGVMGLGGLGHVAIKIAKALGAQVTVFSTSTSKEADAKKLGAKNFVLTSNAENFAAWAGKLDVILDTVSAEHDFSPYLSTLKVGGVLVLLGIPPNPAALYAANIIIGRKAIVGSLVGGLKETQEMLNFCARHKVLADIELISADKINEAYDRTIASDVKYRFVIDNKTL